MSFTQHGGENHHTVSFTMVQASFSMIAADMPLHLVFTQSPIFFNYFIRLSSEHLRWLKTGAAAVCRQFAEILRTPPRHYLS
jgi:hypothetical protein